MVKNLPAMQETTYNVGGVQSLAQKDPLEKEMATRPTILAWRISWTKRRAWRLQSLKSQELDMN